MDMISCPRLKSRYQSFAFSDDDDDVEVDGSAIPAMGRECRPEVAAQRTSYFKQLEQTIGECVTLSC